MSMVGSGTYFISNTFDLGRSLRDGSPAILPRMKYVTMLTRSASMMCGTVYGRFKAANTVVHLVQSLES